MKIVFTSIFRPGLGGGAGRVAHEIARYCSLKHDVVMICPAVKTEFYQDEHGLNIYGIRSAGPTEIQIPDLSAKTVRYLFDFLDDFQPDIVHAHDPALMGLIGQVWARMNLVPFVHTSHVLPSKALDFGTTDAINFPILRNSVSNYAIHSVLSNFYLNCDALIALNQTALDSIREFGYTGPIYIVPNGRALAHYSSCQPADIQEETKILAFIGFLNKRKNQAYLLKVLRALPANYVLRLAGKPLNQDYQDKLDDYIKKHNLVNVEFVGQLDHEDIPVFLRDAHVFASASQMEVQSLVIIEALASGTPVVGLSNETIDELINDDVGAWIAKDQKPEEFAKQIERICNLSPADYELMCQSARDRVAHLDWSHVVDATVNAYHDLQNIQPTINDNESDILTSLVTFLSMGDVKDYLLGVIEETRDRLNIETNRKHRIKVPAPIRPLIRVPSSTWMLSGLTIVGSVIGFLFMRGRGKNKN